MADSRELRTLRDRQAATLTALDRLAYAPPGAAPMLVQVYQQTTIPTTTGKYYACHPVDPGGAECEGCIPTFTAETGTVFVLVVGNRVPVAGDYLKAKPIGGRWLADSGKATTSACTVSPFCVRAFPTTIYVGDDLGTTPLTRILLSDTTASYQSDILDYPVTTVEFDSGTSGPCHVTGDTGTVRYTFGITCNTTGPNAGKLTGTLKKLFWGRCCGTIPTQTSHAGIGTPTIDRPLATASAVFECGATGVDIVFPTTIAICPPSTSAMAMPGGGGVIPITF